MFLRALYQLHCQYVARRAVQYIIGRGAQQQRQAMTPMAANDDKVAVLFFGQVMDFLAWLAIGQVALVFFNAGYLAISRSRRSLA